MNGMVYVYVHKATPIALTITTAFNVRLLFLIMDIFKAGYNILIIHGGSPVTRNVVVVGRHKILGFPSVYTRKFWVLMIHSMGGGGMRPLMVYCTGGIRM